MKKYSSNIVAVAFLAGVFGALWLSHCVAVVALPAEPGRVDPR